MSIGIVTSAFVIAAASGLCYIDIPHPNPQPALPRDGSYVRQAEPGPELDAYNEWYRHWRKTQFIRQYYECPAQPSGCLITAPPSEETGRTPKLHRIVDTGEPVAIPEPWIIGTLIASMLLVLRTRTRKIAKRNAEKKGNE